MRKSPVFLVFKFFGTKFGFWLSVSIGFILINLGLLSLAMQLSTQAVAQLSEAEFTAAGKSTQQARILVSIYQNLTLSLVPDFVVWDQALSAVTTTIKTEQQLEVILKSALQTQTDQSLAALLPNLQQLSQSSTTINSLLPKTWLIQKLLPKKYTLYLGASQQWLTDIQTLLTFLVEDKQTWVVLLQNDDELRATGGFPGSYVLLNFDQGALAEMIVEDIYDADGQFNGYVSPPAGIKEYTSANRGLRLPDSNWWPDFPKSAETILRFFALGDKSNVTGLIAINLSTAKKILAITGPIWLPDYQVTVTDQNIGEVLRAERSEFFPGSSQKKHLLSQTLTQLKQKLIELDSNQQRQLLNLLWNEVREKNIQAHSLQPSLEEIFSRYQLTGALGTTLKWQTELDQCHCQPVWVGVVESNVGINKVNKFVTRTTKINFADKTAQIDTTFTNQATPLTKTELSALLDTPVLERPRNGNGYLNYYRLLISPEYQVNKITLGELAVTSWDDELITTSQGLNLRQIGVLVPVPEQQSTTINFELSGATATPKAAAIYKQSGLPPTRYTVTAPQFSNEFDLTQDTLITF